MRTIVIALAPLALLVVACSAASPSDATGETSEAMLVPNPILFPNCETEALSTAAIGKAMTEEPGNCWWENTSTSPNPYGGQWCSETYVVEIDQMQANRPVAALGAYASQPWGATECGDAHLSTTLWGHTSAGWKQVGTQTSHGVWSTGSLFSLCTMVPDHTTGTLDVSGTEGFDELRVGVSAWEVTTVNGQAGKDFVPVTAGITGGAAC